jgi:hypothetical protein
MKFVLPFAAVSLFVVIMVLARTHEQPALAEAVNAEPAKEEAVEEDMHEFMEYVFQPPYKRLKAALAIEPADKNEWKTVKSDSLILAESTNLLLSRAPEEDGMDWISHSTAVRSAGSQLYQAAKKRDYAATRSSFASMLNKCNACHRQFEDGKHILTP